METTTIQKIGIALSLLGGVLLLGFKWAGPYIILMGVIIVVVGLVLSLRKGRNINESKWVNDTTHSGDD